MSGAGEPLCEFSWEGGGVGRLGSLRDFERGLVYMVRTASESSIWGGGEGLRRPTELNGELARESKELAHSESALLLSESIAREGAAEKEEGEVWVQRRAREGAREATGRGNALDQCCMLERRGLDYFVSWRRVDCHATVRVVVDGRAGGRWVVM